MYSFVLLIVGWHKLGRSVDASEEIKENLNGDNKVLLAIDSAQNL